MMAAATDRAGPFFMSCQGKIDSRGGFPLPFPVVYDLEYHSPMMVVFLYYRRGISTSCQINSISVLKAPW